MNIFNRIFLYLALLPSALYRRMGVNTVHLRAILVTKLLMDDRRVNGVQQQKRKKDKPPKYATLGTMLITAIMGCAFLFSFLVGNDYLTKLTIYFAMYIFTLTSVLISDFTSVLIDVRDNLILLPKPIGDRTFVLARLLHIVIHVTKMVLPMTLPGLIALSWKEGWSGALPFVLVTASATLFIIFLINAIYLLILKITTPQKFKNIISYFQIFFAIAFYAGYQIIPRIIGKAALSAYSVQHMKYPWLIVSYWFAAAWQFFQDLGTYGGLWIYLALTIVLPVLSIWLVVRYFAPSFNSKLSMISGSEGETQAPVRAGKKQRATTSRYIATLAQWLTTKGTERVAFLQAWKITGRSRDFKMKVYPSIGYLVVYLVLIFFRKGKLDVDPGQLERQLGIIFMSLIYFTSFVLMVAINQVSVSDKFKAAWIYYVTPIATPGQLFSGALKATIVKFYLPVVVASFIAAMIVIGLPILPNLLLAMFNQLLIISSASYIVMRELPFSVQPSLDVKGAGFLRGLLSMILPICICILHFLVYKYMAVVSILAVLSAIAAWLMMDALRNKSWEKVRLREYE